MITASSAARLIEGGPAILQMAKINHHILIEGLIINIPFVRTRLRVLSESYEILARQNIPDEHRPWAIIMIIAPVQLHVDRIIIPKMTNAIWPTEE